MDIGGNMKNKQISVYYKTTKSEWKFHGIYTKTDALGTAKLCLKEGWEVRLVPKQEGKDELL